jgi:hypothetical protein
VAHDWTGTVRRIENGRALDILLAEAPDNDGWRVVAEAIKSPDEIWLRWEELRTRPGQYSLRRRFIARRRIAGDDRELLSVFEYGADGWRGATSLPATGRNAAQRRRYINRQRSGLLVYRRKD